MSKIIDFYTTNLTSIAFIERSFDGVTFNMYYNHIYLCNELFVFLVFVCIVLIITSFLSLNEVI
jgi:hypothetical protein